MKLDVNGTVQAFANEAALRLAFEQRPHAGDWSVTLEPDDGDYLQAFARSGEHFRLNARVGAQNHDGVEPVRADEAQAVLADYLNGGDAWKQAIAWDRPTEGAGNIDDLARAVVTEVRQRRAGKAPSLAPGQLSPIAVVSVIVVLALFGYGMLHLGWLHQHLRFLPWPFDTTLGVGIASIALLPAALSVVLVAVKLSDVRRAAAWPAVAGRVVRSEMGASAAPSRIANARFDQVPRVTYEFDWEGRHLSGQRIGFGDDSVGPNAAAVLARYPVGQAVTVYVNPRDARESVLERTAPPGFIKGLAALALALLLLAAVVAGALRAGGDWIRSNPALLAHARNPPLAALSGFMGLGTLLLVLTGLLRALRSARWPVVLGVVTFSGLREDSVLINHRQSAIYEPHVEFRYEVASQSYVGQHLVLGTRNAYNRATAQAKLARYPKGRTLKVRYNPANPGEAYVEPPTALWLIALIGVALSAFGAYQAGWW